MTSANALLDAIIGRFQLAVMKAVAMEPLTVEDYRLWPDAGPRYQLIEGDLYLAPAPNRYHQDISFNITALCYPPSAVC